ncbi:MAG: hypothetical protein ACFFCW_19810 [Candidatus Hodarchaeota archaeon]
MEWTELCVKVAQIEIMLQNHIHWHETVERYFLFPTFVGVMILTIKEFITWIRNRKRR